MSLVLKWKSLTSAILGLPDAWGKSYRRVSRKFGNLGEAGVCTVPPTSPTPAAVQLDAWKTSSEMKVLILLVLASAAYGQVPEPCRTPSVWESNVGVQDFERGIFVRAKLSYDSHNMRIRRIEEVDESRTDKEYYDILYLHNTMPGKEYRFNLRTKQCETRELNYPFRPIEIPMNANHFGDFTVGTKGAPHEGVVVSMWGERNQQEGTDWVGVFTYTGCVPVNDMFYSNRTGRVTTEFFDVTLGLSNPDVFIPPRECIMPPPPY
ncbi:Mammalian ependymin- protein 1 [Branchiostoma belcheri]|nr:Mammalian ependymin- protein 1 [Branchiostoma belcheri]